MRCLYCRSHAGILRRICSTCGKVMAVVERAGGEVGLAQLVDAFAAEGLTKEHVNRVLDAQIGDNPTVRDRLTSNMANFLMRNLGMPGRQTPEDVRKVRLAAASGEGAGTWAAGEKASPGNFH